MSGDNAPNAVQTPPYPNVHINFARKVEVHVINFTGADGAVTYNAAKSSGGTGITRTGEGTYTLTFPAGGTGALGWILPSVVESPTSTVAIARLLSLDNDVVATNFAAGSTGIVSTDQAATNAVNDIIGDMTILVFVVKA